MANNTLQYAEVKAKLDLLVSLTDNVNSSLNDISALISETVNTGRGVWDGNAAAQFLTKWKELDAELPDFIASFKKQAENVQTVLTQTKIADEVAE